MLAKLKAICLGKKTCDGEDNFLLRFNNELSSSTQSNREVLLILVFQFRDEH